MHFQDLHKIDKGTLVIILTLSAKGVMAGKCLGIELLERSALYIMETIELVADKEPNVKLKYYIDKGDVF